MKPNKIVALLPMKAHSERISGKNFRDLAGKPLFRHILDALLEVDAIEQVVINTDAREILAENGLIDSDRVVIRDRLDQLCGDTVSMNLVLSDDVEAVNADVYLMTHTTNPLITADTIRKALEEFSSGDECDSLFSVNKIQTRFYRKSGSAINHDPEHLVRTQDLEEWFEENSCIYCFTRESFSSTAARIGKRPKLFVTPPLESIDIDEPHDWEMVEALIEKRNKNAA